MTTTSKELKEFTRNDWEAFSGAEEFEDGSSPLVGCTDPVSDEAFIILVDPRGIVVSFPDTHEAHLPCGNVLTKTAMVAIAEKLLNSEITIELLEAYGFEDI